MTNSELVDKLNQAQSLLSEVYDWATMLTDGKLHRNAAVSSALSCADSCICEALDALDMDE